MSDEEHEPLKDLDPIHVEYLNRLQKQSAEAAAVYRAEAVKWCAENLKSDVYEIVDGKCVVKNKEGNNETVVI